MFQNRTILLIDDEAQIRRVLRAALSGHGANILDAQSGEEGLDILRRNTVDVVLLDLNMPGIGGLDTCRAIRAGWDVPVIVVSVRDSHKDKVEALEAVGIHVVERISAEVEPLDSFERYVQVKQEKMGHIIDRVPELG